MIQQIDMTKVEAQAGKVIGDVAGALSLFMAYIGDQAGLFDALDGEGRMSVQQLSDKTGYNPKYLHEWLGSVSAAGYITFHPEDETFSISPEQALVMGREGQPACMQGFIQAVVSQYEEHEKSVETFKSGQGRAWGEHSQCLFCGTDRFFRPGYQANLVDSWIPSLKDVEGTLKEGAKVVVDVDGKKYSMFSKADSAWMENAAEEPQLVAALRAGRSMTVSATSRRGTNTSYTYSLSGVTTPRRA